MILIATFQVDLLVFVIPLVCSYISIIPVYTVSRLKLFIVENAGYECSKWIFQNIDFYMVKLHTLKCGEAETWSDSIYAGALQKR